MSVNVGLEFTDSLQPREGVREVRDETQLADWLRNRSVQDGVVVAVRAALRCLWAPICSTRNWEQLSLVSFRVCSLGVIAASEEGRAKTPSPALLQACSETKNDNEEVLALCRALMRVVASVEFESFERLQAIAEVARCSADIVSWPADRKDSWDELNSDVQTFGQSTAKTVIESGLFSGNASKHIIDEVTHSNARFRTHGLGFLADWYEAMVNGAVQDVELLREIVALPEEDWAQGAEHVGEMISAIEVGRRLREATPLAEEIVFDDSLGKLRVEPIRMLPVDVYETGLEKLRDAVADARRATARSNSYTALESTLEMLDRTLSRYTDNAQRVHDDQLLASRRILRLLDDGYVPDDHEVASLLQVLDTNAIDIRAAVPEVAVAVNKRSKVRIQELSPDDQNRLQSTVEAVALNSDEALAEEMREDQRATFGVGDAPVNVEGPYRLTSRLARAAKVVRDLGEITGFADKHGSMISSLGNDLVKLLGKFVGL